MTVISVFFCPFLTSYDFHSFSNTNMNARNKADLPQSDEPVITVKPDPKVKKVSS
jgi:hypothetical protein